LSACKLLLLYRLTKFFLIGHVYVLLETGFPALISFCLRAGIEGTFR